MSDARAEVLGRIRAALGPDVLAAVDATWDCGLSQTVGGYTLCPRRS